MSDIALTKSGFTAGVLSPALFARVDLSKFDLGAKTLENFLVHAEGGVSNRPGTEFVLRARGDRIRLIPFAFSTEQTYVLELGEGYLRVVKDGAVVTEPSRAVAGVAPGDPVVLTVAGHGYGNGDWIFLEGLTGPTALNGRFWAVTVTGADSVSLSDLDGRPLDGTGLPAWSGGGTAERVYRIATPWSADELERLKFVQSADTMYLAHPGYAPRKLTRSADDAWSLEVIDFQPSIAPPGGLSASGGSGGPAQYYRVTAVKAETFEESTPASASVGASPTSGSPVNLSWAAVAGAAKYNVYKLDNGIYGWIGASETTAFADDNIAPDVSDTPPTGRNPFAAAGAYPATVGLHEQRSVWGASDDDPQKTWMSTSANYENLNVSTPSKDDDAVTFTIAARQVNEIRHYVSLSDLLLFTSGGEFKVNGGDEVALTPSNVNVKPQSYRGCSHVPPVVIGNTVLFVRYDGRAVYDLGYQLAVDGYSGNEVTVLAKHLFRGEGRIREMAYAQTPWSVVWCVLGDGRLAALTYMREHDVWAWHSHVTEGAFESVAVVRENDEDVVYLAVRRTVEGSERVYLERMKEREDRAIEEAFFLDSGLSYDGPATRELSGLGHLEGETVAILADGGVQPRQVVTGGRISLQTAAERVHVGLPYEATIETLPVTLSDPAAAAKRLRIHRVLLRVLAARGVRVGPGGGAGELVEVKQRAGEPYGTPTRPFTGQIGLNVAPEWADDTTILVRQSDPLPITVLGMTAELEIGG
ncbi:hypothetical protein SAMN06265365_12329 [Tistlia consotensis]|uniref:Uncharacterized protein n=1 Tax=Tistlia consotensis USBA 355 TaxID=560819 RepID=A0A1Y6CHL8_9PROT|nr:hypothetical protein [Tistlia consotensis]SMF64690.1 hypothetical protein SAMN05428998_12580 [Tistlia consotensis USBA 355]SNR96969.1 hypothetical protein SAMN06265365_12329 [Tistlia consotensis]